MTNMDLLHQVDMDIVKEVVRICNAHGFKYYMLGGTMLGAIRHKGFIPWDDDIDLGMPRDDYEAFLELADKEFADQLSADQVAALGAKAKQRIADAYSWQFICSEYEQLFLGNN